MPDRWTTRYFLKGFFLLGLLNVAFGEDPSASVFEKQVGPVLQNTRERLIQVEQALADVRKTDRLALVLLQLRTAIQGHFPFEREVALARLVGQGKKDISEALDVLAPHATTGVATVAELRDSFGMILLPKLQSLLEGEQTWGEWARGWMATTIASGLKPTPRQQQVISATDRLTEDDLSGAVEEISKMDGPAATMVARWLQEANARLAIDRICVILAKMGVEILSRP
ncbi:hypothetical protein CCP3SC1AL1_1290007 [Gammaproteobacteria bacterium]